MNVTLRALAAAGLVVGMFGLAVAKLPPPTPEQKAAAEARKEKAAEATAKAKKELEQAEDRAVANYKANMKGKAGDAASNVAIGAPKPGNGSTAPAK
jgi:hypothetical protein